MNMKYYIRYYISSSVNVAFSIMPTIFTNKPYKKPHRVNKPTVFWIICENQNASSSNVVADDAKPVAEC